MTAFAKGFWEGLNPLWSVMWAAYWLGHLASLVLERRDTERWAAFWYPIYNGLMLFSSRLQDRFSFDGPWTEYDPTPSKGQP